MSAKKPRFAGFFGQRRYIVPLWIRVWSTVEDVRTGIQNHDSQILTLVSQLRRLHALVHSKGLAVSEKEEKLAA
jgi:hypothetical protein